MIFWQKDHEKDHSPNSKVNMLAHYISFGPLHLLLLHYNFTIVLLKFNFFEQYLHNIFFNPHDVRENLQYQYTSHKINVGLLRFYCFWKAQCEHCTLGLCFQLIIMNQNWVIFIKLIYACIAKDKTNILTQYPHVGHENRCWFWELQNILNMVV
jgi:hypothetical protein